MDIKNYIGEFLVSLGAVLTSAAVLGLAQYCQIKTRNHLSAATNEQTPFARWGLLTAGFLLLSAGCAALFFR